MLCSVLIHSRSVPRSLLFFVIRDHLGHTPLSNLRNTILQDLKRIWASLSKPQGLENSKIEDYFDFAFVTLPHKILQPDRFVTEVDKLSSRFREGYKDPKTVGLLDEATQPILLPEYHRRIPADGFSVYAQGVWDQIVSNKDLDLPTQQELLAQFRCDEIAREALIPFSEAISPLESRQSEAVSAGKPRVIPELGDIIRKARQKIFNDFESEASRYHKTVYKKKHSELEEKVDTRLKFLFKGQLSAAHKSGIYEFTDAVSNAVRIGQKKGSHYEFAEIVGAEKKRAITRFEKDAKSSQVEAAPWSTYQGELKLFLKDLDEIGAKLRKDEMRRLATRVERWIKSKLDESVGVEFNRLGSGRGGSGASNEAEKSNAEKDLWDKIWSVFVKIVEHAEKTFSERARSFDASPEEVEVGLWRLRRKSWAVLRSKIDEEVAEGNLLLKLREKYVFKFFSGSSSFLYRLKSSIVSKINSAMTKTASRVSGDRLTTLKASIHAHESQRLLLYLFSPASVSHVPLLRLPSTHG